MKVSERQGNNIHTFNINECGERYNEEVVKAIEHHCKATVDILFNQEEEGYQMEEYDEESGSFSF